MEYSVCFGEISLNVFGPEIRPSSSVMNIAYHLERHNQKTYLVSALGNDIEGKLLLYYLQSKGINTGFITNHSQFPTARTVIGNPQSVQPVAWDDIAVTNALKKTVKGAKYFIFTAQVGRNEKTRATLTELIKLAKNPVFNLDLSTCSYNRNFVERLLFHSKIVKLSITDLIEIALWNEIDISSKEDAIKAIGLTYNVDIVLVTDGKFAIAYNRKLNTLERQLKNSPEQADGVEDSFLAGFLAQYSSPSDTSSAMEYGNKLASFVGTRIGETPNYSPEQLQSVLA